MSTSPRQHHGHNNQSPELHIEGGSEFHIYSGGNHGGFNECMRGTNGVCAYVGPEAKPMLDPRFPPTGSSDPKTYVDMPRLLECASGGPYVWNTATESRRIRAMASRAGGASLDGEGEEERAVESAGLRAHSGRQGSRGGGRGAPRGTHCDTGGR